MPAVPAQIGPAAPDAGQPSVPAKIRPILVRVGGEVTREAGGKEVKQAFSVRSIGVLLHGTT